MDVGDRVVCLYNNGYLLTVGKEYVVLRYEPTCPDLNFTWPAYVYVEDDEGRMVVCHAQRFKKEAEHV